MVGTAEPKAVTRAPILWSRIVAWQARLSLDPAIRDALVGMGHPPGSAIDGLVTEYLRFQYLDTRIPGGAVPSPSIRALRDAHRRDAAGYAAFVEDLLGAPGEDVDTPDTPEGYARTLDAYRREFGKPDPEAWPARNDGKPFETPWRRTYEGRRVTSNALLCLSFAAGLLCVPAFALGLAAGAVALVAFLALLMAFGLAWDALQDPFGENAGRRGDGGIAPDVRMRPAGTT